MYYCNCPYEILWAVGAKEPKTSNCLHTFSIYVQCLVIILIILCPEHSLCSLVLELETCKSNVAITIVIYAFSAVTCENICYGKGQKSYLNKWKSDSSTMQSRRKIFTYIFVFFIAYMLSFMLQYMIQNLYYSSQLYFFPWYHSVKPNSIHLCQLFWLVDK